MRLEQWNAFLQATQSPYTGDEKPLISLIVDSPWLPGAFGIGHLDYYFSPKTWLDINIQICRQFPEIVFLPGFWVEYGMAIEPSAFGAKVRWWKDNTPSIEPMLGEDWQTTHRLKIPDPTTDGLMAVALNMYEKHLPDINASGYLVKFASARGPLALASHLRGITEFLLDLELNPNGTKNLLEITTETVILWLKAQAKVLPDVEAILLLDDIPGMLSPRHFERFAYPYLKAVFNEFPGFLKVYHNDANVEPFMGRLPDLGIDVLNFTHNIDIQEIAKKQGGRVCLLGNLPPVSVLVDGSPEFVGTKTQELVKKAVGQKFILSAGGGLSPGTPMGNLTAIVRAVESI